jgi:hypothetical protein
MASRFVRWCWVISAAALVLGAACGPDSTTERLQAEIAERAADPAHALSTTVPGSPTTTTLDDPFVSFHTSAEITDEQFERLRRGVILARIEMGFDGRLDVYAGTEAGGGSGEWDGSTGAIAVDQAELAAPDEHGRNLFVVAAARTARVAQLARAHGSILPGESSVDDSALLIDAPVWLAVGHAELVAWRLARAHDELETSWAEQRAILVDLATADEIPLEADESVALGSSADGREALWYLALELLDLRAGSAAVHAELWPQVAASGWESALASVFGVTPEEFYAEFAVWRADGFPAA